MKAKAAGVFDPKTSLGSQYDITTPEGILRWASWANGYRATGDEGGPDSETAAYLARAVQCFESLRPVLDGQVPDDDDVAWYSGTELERVRRAVRIAEIVDGRASTRGGLLPVICEAILEAAKGGVAK